GGTILIENGKISRIGTNVQAPAGAEVIDAKGKAVMPGLVAARLSGLVGGSTKKVADALNPYHQVVSFALASGITAGYVQVGSAGSASTGGTNAVVRMAEGDLDGMLLREPVAINMAYSNSRPRLKALLRLDFARAQEYLRKKAQYDKDKAAGKKVEEPKAPSGIEPMLKLLRRELPARMSASSANDILGALELVDDFGIRLIIEGVVEGWTIAEEIAKRDVDVIITPRRMQSSNRDITAPTGSCDRQAAMLKRAGVRLAIVPTRTSFSTWGGFGDDLFTLPLEAAYAVGGGLDEQTALEAITINPAAMLGVGDRIGSLQEGKDADMIILDGHPLHYSTFVELTLVNGKVLYDKSKSTYFSHIRPTGDDPAADETEE
ncbi:MAG: amidohydrolase family protein, partial [Armatimonadota bacterium]